MDTVDKKTRSRIMASVRQKDTAPEIRLRCALHKLGFRYVTNDRRLPGSPDLVLPKYRAVIFIHGCFWHNHGCKRSTVPETRTDFWRTKFVANRERDTRKVTDLRRKGWRVKVIWECQIERAELARRQAEIAAKWLIRLSPGPNSSLTIAKGQRHPKTRAAER